MKKTLLATILLVAVCQSLFAGPAKGLLDHLSGYSFLGKHMDNSQNLFLLSFYPHGKARSLVKTDGKYNVHALTWTVKGNQLWLQSASTARPVKFAFEAI